MAYAAITYGTDDNSSDDSASGGASAGVVTLDAVNISAAGHTIPLLFGGTKSVGAPLWAAPVQTNADGTRLLTFAVAFGRRGPLTETTALEKVWFDNVLMFSGGEDGLGSAGFDYTFYDGSSGQLPDPTIAGIEGANNTPAFRGLIYVVVRNYVVPLGSSFPVVVGQIMQTVTVGANRYVVPFLTGDASKGGGLFSYNKSRNMLVQYNGAALEGFTFDIFDTMLAVPLTSAFAAGSTGLSGGCFVLAADGQHAFATLSNGFEAGQAALYDIGSGAQLARIGDLSTATGPLNMGYGIDAAHVAACAGADEWFALATLIPQQIIMFRVNGAGMTLAYKFTPSSRFTLIHNPDAVILADLTGITKYNTRIETDTGSIPLSQPAYDSSYVLGWTKNDSTIAQFIYAPSGTATLIDDAFGQYVNVSYPDLSYVINAAFQVHTTCRVGTRIDDVFKLEDHARPDIIDEHIETIFVSADGTYIIALTYGTDPTGAHFISRYLHLTTVMQYCVNGPQPGDTAFPQTINMTYAQYQAANGANDISSQYGTLAQLKLRAEYIIPACVPSTQSQTHAAKQIPKGQYKYAYSEAGTDNWIVLDLRDGSWKRYEQGIYLNSFDPTINYGSKSVVTSNAVYDSERRIYLYAGAATLPDKPGYVTLEDSLSGTGTLSVATLLTSLGIIAGFDQSVIECDGVDEYVVGCIINTQADFSDLASNICALFCIDIIQTEGKLKFRRRNGQAVDRALTRADLATVDQNSADDGTLLSKSRASSTTLPSTLEVDYLDSENDFQVGAQTAKRTVYPYKAAAGLNARQLGVPLAMPAANALYWAEFALYNSWATALQVTGLLPIAHLDLEPGDYVSLDAGDDGQYTLKLTDVYLNADWSVSFVASTVVFETPATIVTDAPTLANNNGQDAGAPTVAKLIAVENIGLTFDTGTVPTLAFFGNGTGYVRYYKDATNFDRFNIGRAVSIGTILNDHPAQTYWNADDDATALTVRMDSGTPLPCGDAAYQAGSNQALIGAPGRWEIINYRDVVPNQDGTFAVAHILRGRNGSEDAMLLQRQGDLFVPLANAIPADYRAYGTGAVNAVFATGSKTVTASIIPVGGSLKPFAPCQISAHISGSDVVITWVRRDRAPSDIADGNDDPPMSEATEAYDIEILGSDKTVKRTASALSAATFTYTAAMAAADGLDVSAAISVNVYQLSAVVGRGHKGTATCRLI